MILAEYNNKRITFENLKDKLVDNELSEFFLETLILNLSPLKLFLKECLKDNLEIERIELFTSDYNNKKIRLGLVIKDKTTSELLEKFKYLDNRGAFIFFMESYHYAKDLYNYNPKETPYIMPQKSLI